MYINAKVKFKYKWHKGYVKSFVEGSIYMVKNRKHHRTTIKESELLIYVGALPEHDMYLSEYHYIFYK